MKKFINQLPLTRMKLFLAGILYRIVHLLYRSDKRTIVRGGIKYEIDLSEAIDLSIFLFGSFQKHIHKNKYFSFSRDAVVLDVGANVGVMSLQFARLAPLGKVYSFEPTHYAFSKLQKNIELNPELSKRIVPIQSFVSSSTIQSPNIAAYASWKIAGKIEDARHQVHGGSVKTADGIAAVSLDDFCTRNEFARLDFIKIDTDGHELEVLKGAEKIIHKFNPVIIFEIGIYIMNEKGIKFSDYSEFFESLNYSLFNSTNLKKINTDNYLKHIPLKGTIDILAVSKTQKI